MFRLINGPSQVLVRTAAKTIDNSTSQYSVKVNYSSKIELSPFPSKLDRVDLEQRIEMKSDDSSWSYSVRSPLNTKVKYPSNSYAMRELEREAEERKS